VVRKDNTALPLEIRLELRQSGTTTTEWGWAQRAAHRATLTETAVSSVHDGIAAGQFSKGDAWLWDSCAVLHETP